MANKEVKAEQVADGFFKDNTVEVEIDGRKVRVFNQEADKIKSYLAKQKK